MQDFFWIIDYKILKEIIKILKIEEAKNMKENMKEKTGLILNIKAKNKDKILE